MYSVALIGHSNLPVFPSYGDVQISHFKYPGALLSDIWNPRKFDQRMLDTAWDCVILFLGGNDLAVHKEHQPIFEIFLKVLDALKKAKRVLVTELEPRTYTRAKEIQYGITTSRYNKRRDIINKQWKRYAKNTRSFQIIHVPPGYQGESHDGGIHLGIEGQRNLIRKYKGWIERSQREARC